MIRKISNISRFAGIVTTLFLCFLFVDPALAASCKGMSKSSCSSNSACSWVGSYTTKKGVNVNAFCRSKPGSGSTKTTKKSAAKKAVSKKKESSKSLKKEKADKVKSESKKEKKKAKKSKDSKKSDKKKDKKSQNSKKSDKKKEKSK